MTIQQGMASLALSYRLIEARQGFLDVYAGARFNYLSMNLAANPDSSGIQSVSEAAAEKITSLIGRRVDNFLSANSAALQSAMVENIAGLVTDKALAKAADFNPAAWFAGHRFDQRGRTILAPRGFTYYRDADYLFPLLANLARDVPAAAARAGIDFLIAQETTNHHATA